jgi:hypothetical protein
MSRQYFHRFGFFNGLLSTKEMCKPRHIPAPSWTAAMPLSSFPARRRQGTQLAVAPDYYSFANEAYINNVMGC